VLKIARDQGKNEMKKQTHTPGPWLACLNVPTAIIPGHIIKADYDPNRPIASLWRGGGSKGELEQIANARLIAAAPDLLAACEEFVLKCETGKARSVHSYAQMKAAIAKATVLRKSKA
jgi:hypothetical protein